MIKPNFKKEDVKKHIAKGIEAYKKKVILRLKYAGELFVQLARDTGNYTDQTGNLRASVGYMIFDNGKLISEAFPGEQPDGVEAGKELAKDKANKQGLVLIGVAGMDYAAAVESNGKDVITGSNQLTEAWLKKALKQIK